MVDLETTESRKEASRGSPQAMTWLVWIAFVSYFEIVLLTATQQLDICGKLGARWSISQSNLIYSKFYMLYIFTTK